MNARWSLAMALVLGCGTKTAPPPVDQPAGADQDRAARGEPVNAPKAREVSACAAPAVTEAQAAAAFAESEKLDAQVKAGELDRNSSWSTRYQLYDRAARGGHRDAQARAGAMKFASMFASEAPKPEDRAAYVEAMTRLIIAARRGNTDAAKFMPGMEALMFGQIPEMVEPPLSQIDKTWVKAALAAADQWIQCHAKR